MSEPWEWLCGEERGRSSGKVGKEMAGRKDRAGRNPAFKGYTPRRK